MEESERSESEMLDPHRYSAIMAVHEAGSATDLTARENDFHS